MTIHHGSTTESPRFCDYEGSDYRTAFWEGQGREYEDLAERIALRTLLPHSGQRLIDIGGGFGRLVDLYAGYREIVLMDASRSQLEDARQRLDDPRIVYVAANIYEMPFSEASFDTAVMVRVLHHLSDVPMALRSIRAVLSSGSPLVMEYANKRNIKAMARYWMRRASHNPFGLEPYEFVPLNFNFHPAYMESHLSRAGFRVGRQLAVSHFRLAPLKRVFPAPLLAYLDGLLQQPTGRWRLTPSMFVQAHATPEGPSRLVSRIFSCPTCRFPLAQEYETLRCDRCGRRWSTSGGIHDFRQTVS